MLKGSKRRIALVLVIGLLFVLLLGALDASYTRAQIPQTTNQLAERSPRTLHAPRPSDNPQHHMSQPPPPSLPQVGFQRTFWILDQYGYLTGTAPPGHYTNELATLLAAGEHGAVFFTNGCIDILGEVQATDRAVTLSQVFDTTIYPCVTDLAGHPDGTTGDIDGDPRIYILVSEQIVSYYSQTNELPNGFLSPYSNECEMFYLYYQTNLERVAAHEFHHLVWFNNEVDEQQFAIEGLARYAEYYAGYFAAQSNLSAGGSDFLAHPDDSLLYWNTFSEDGRPTIIDYAGAYLLTAYIAEIYGVDILRNLIHEPTDGARGIETTLHAAGYSIAFNDLYLDWITTLTINQRGFADNRYGYRNIDARITSYGDVTLPHFEEAFDLHYYGTTVHRISSPSDGLVIRIQKQVENTVGFIVAFHDALGWHVQQHMIPEGVTLFTEIPVGIGIDDVYIITSFMLANTPNPSRAVGLGPTIPITLTITSILPPIVLPIATLLVLIVLSIAFIIYFCKIKHVRPTPR